MEKNKTAIITGAGKGIGKAIAIGLAKLNYKTILIGRNRKDLEQVAVLINDRFAIESKILQLDITNKLAVKEAIPNLVSENGRIDVLVNNAGIYFSGTVDTPTDDFEKMLDTNLVAQFKLLKEVVPIMKAQKSGYIFNVASRSGKVGFATSGTYSASKFGMVG
ncbi:MAG TPA: SDR family oxidoreductase, partial [Draconibacterium sp.]|nr:SDR family oxidoreductase [Draconibacterium sp.]